MSPHLRRASAALAFASVTGIGGYLIGQNGSTSAETALGGVVLPAPAPNTTRLLYSLDQKQNDQELIALIDATKKRAYFAMYEFTLKDIADALVAAKRRGVDVRGLVDAGESANSYDAPIMTELSAAGIPIETEHHVDGQGIMHIKALVTDTAYAIGSYNWTSSATNENDEILEIGTSPVLVSAYASLLERLLQKYAGTAAAAQSAAASASIGTIDYTEAPQHIGAYASVRGTLISAYTASSGTVFLDFCKSYKTCPFSAVIFSGDTKAFGDLSRLAGKTVTLTGTITAYNSRAEIKLTNPNQLSVAP